MVSGLLKCCPVSPLTPSRHLEDPDNRRSFSNCHEETRQKHIPRNFGNKRRKQTPVKVIVHKVATPGILSFIYSSLTSQTWIVVVTEWGISMKVKQWQSASGLLLPCVCTWRRLVMSRLLWSCTRCTSIGISWGEVNVVIGFRTTLNHQVCRAWSKDKCIGEQSVGGFKQIYVWLMNAKANLEKILDAWWKKINIQVGFLILTSRQRFQECIEPTC